MTKRKQTRQKHNWKHGEKPGPRKGAPNKFKKRDRDAKAIREQCKKRTRNG